MEILRTLIGPDGGHADVWQMCVRTLIVFAVGIAYIRIAGRRTFSQAAPLDIVVAIVVGSNLSRSTTGATPFWPSLAATLLLVRQYALDYGAEGIRANAVNADRIRSGLLTPQMIATRSKARGLSEHDYMAGNLLAREVTADDVAQAFFHHAVALKTTGDVTTVDGGNIAAALR